MRDVRHRGRMGFHANNARMFIERKNSPMPEMLVHRDKNLPFVDGLPKDFRIVRRFLACLGSTQHIVSLQTQELRQIKSKHLVQVESHRRSPNGNRNNLGVFDRRLGKKNRRLNIFAN